MNRTLAIALAALVCGLGVAAIALTGDDVDFRPVWVIAAPAVGWSFIATGLYAWRARPENRVGELMVILGFAWFNYTLLNADSSLVYTWAAITGGLWGSLFLHLGISFPSGHLDSRGDRALVLAGYVIFPLAFVPTLFFNGDDPRNLLLIEPDVGLTDLMRGIGTAIYVTLFVLVMIRSARHYRRADSFERLQLTPVYTFALLTFALVTFAQVGSRRSGVVRGLRLQRADAVRLHRRADPQPPLAPRRGAAREHCRSCAPRGRGWSRPATPHGASWSATCTTARSHGWWPWR